MCFVSIGYNFTPPYIVLAGRTQARTQARAQKEAQKEVWGRGVDGMSCEGLFIHHVDYKPRGVEHPSQTGIDLADSLCGFKAEMGLQSALSKMFKF